MTERKATCRCGQLSATATGEPFRVSVCHCLNCKKRSGSSFATQARWPADQVMVEGQSTVWNHAGDSGEVTSFHFCPECGATVFYRGGGFPDAIAIAVGAFDDPFFATPVISLYENRKHEWVEIVGDGIDHD